MNPMNTHSVFESLFDFTCNLAMNSNLRFHYLYFGPNYCFLDCLFIFLQSWFAFIFGVSWFACILCVAIWVCILILFFCVFQNWRSVVWDLQLVITTYVAFK